MGQQKTKIGDDDWVTVADKPGFPRTCEAQYVKNIFIDDSAKMEIDEHGREVKNPFPTGTAVDVVCRLDKILFFKYYNHSKTDGEVPEEGDGEMWDFTSCKR